MNDPDVKTCAACRTVFRRRPKQSRPQFARQQCCSDPCARQWRYRDTGETRTCQNPVCGREFRRRTGKRGENRADFRTRKYCSMDCSRSFRPAAAAAEPKTCEGCGNDFEWQPGMSTNAWAARRFCSRVCAGGVPKNPPTHPDFADTGDSKWREQAVCAARAPLFDPSDLWSDSIAAQMQTTALAFCGRCPVMGECGAEADLLRDLGLRGGVYRMRRQGRYWWQRYVPWAPEPQLRDRRVAA